MCVVSVERSDGVGIPGEVVDLRDFVSFVASQRDVFVFEVLLVTVVFSLFHIAIPFICDTNDGLSIS